MQPPNPMVETKKQMKRVVCKKTNQPRTLTSECLYCKLIHDCTREALINKEILTLI